MNLFLAQNAQLAGTISGDLGSAVAQTGVKTPSPKTFAAAGQLPAMATDNAKLLGLTGLSLVPNPQVSAKQAAAQPAVKAQKDDQASSPSLELVMQDTAAKAFGYLDSSAYLSSLFKT